MRSKCECEPRWSVVMHRPVSVYFYIVKYMLAEGWSEPVGMSCGAVNMERGYDIKHRF